MSLVAAPSAVIMIVDYLLLLTIHTSCQRFVRSLPPIPTWLCRVPPPMYSPSQSLMYTLATLSSHDSAMQV